MKRTAGVLVVTSLLLLGTAATACGGATPEPDSTSRSTTIPTTTTTTEPPATWNEIEPGGDTPVARCYQGMVYESEGNRVLVFGGFDGVDLLQDMWSYDAQGERWTDLGVEGDRQPRADKQIPGAYDPAGELVVSFDGTSWGYGVASNEWRALSPKGTKLKPGREGCSMVFDQERGQIILFGGTDNIKSYNETWMYDPAANRWAKVAVEGAAPKGRSDAGMVYDAVNGVVVLFGGVDSDFTCLNDTWTFDPETSTWTRLAPMTRVPSARSAHAMAYDEHSGDVILFGGIDSQFVCYGDTWAYNVAQNTWTELMPVGENPQARCRTQLVYAEAIDKLVLFGGMTFGVNNPGEFGFPSYFGDTWVFGVEP